MAKKKHKLYIIYAVISVCCILFMWVNGWQYMILRARQPTTYIHMDTFILNEILSQPIHITLMHFHVLLIVYITFPFVYAVRAAIMAKIIDRDTQTETSSSSNLTKGKAAQTTKFSIHVQAVFKKSPGRVLAGAPRRAPITLAASTQDLECRCPRLKINK